MIKDYINAESDPPSDEDINDSDYGGVLFISDSKNSEAVDAVFVDTAARKLFLFQIASNISTHNLNKKSQKKRKSAGSGLVETVDTEVQRQNVLQLPKQRKIRRNKWI